MGLMQKLAGAVGFKSGRIGDASFYEAMRLFGFGRTTKSGASVTALTALQVSTVLSCVRVIAEGMAQVPLKLYQVKNGERKVADQHPLHSLLHTKPNEWMSAFQLRETMAMHAVLLGRGHCYVNRASSGKILEILLLRPGTVTVKQNDDWSRTWEVRGQSGATRPLTAEQIWTLDGPSWDGVCGMNMADFAREAIGLAMAAEEAQANIMKNGLNVTGLYSVDNTLNKQQHKDLTQWLIEEKAAVTEGGGVLVLDRNAKYTPISQKPVDAQLLESRRHQVEEICRAFRVLPIMVGYSDKSATYASAEAMFQAHVVYTLAAWYQRIEQSIAAQLLTDKERAEGYYPKHTVAGLLRGSMKDTAEYLHKLVLDGILTRNEARELLEFNPLEGLDEPLTPANTVVAAQPSDAIA